MCALMTREWTIWAVGGTAGLLLVLVVLSIAAFVKYLLGGGSTGRNHRAGTVA